MQINRFDHLVITTQNLEKCLYFYGEIINMNVDTAKGRYALKFGRQKINIHRQKAEFKPAALNVTYGSQDLCFIVDGDIKDIKAEIEKKGYPIELGIVARNGALGPMDSIYLRDPDGNLIELSVYKKQAAEG